MNTEDAKIIPAIASQSDAIARAIEVIADRLQNGGRLVYVGAGTSGRLGVLDAAECPPTFNSDPEQVVGIIAGGHTALTRAVEGAEDHAEAAVHDLTEIGFTAADVLVGIATSGRTPYVLGAVKFARDRGAFTIGLSCNSRSELISRVNLAITPVVGPEVLSGSTRLKAGTATKMVLNMLSTGAMVRLGKTFGNLMVDLRATNEKLQARSNRIVRDATGLDRTGSDELLDRCGRELKTALVSHLSAISPDAARARLHSANGRVRAAIVPAHANEFVDDADEIFLGIDGGGTRTVALLSAPDGDGGWRLLGRGEAGPSNRQAVGTEAALAALDCAIDQAFATAGLRRRSVTAACLGLAGAGRVEDQAVVRDWANWVGLADVVEVTTDTALLLAAGTPNGWGVAVVAGTGSMVFARDPDGRTARAGGWGYLLGDEGSGYAVALAGLRAAVKAADGRGPATQLTDHFLVAYGMASPDELVRAVYRGGCRVSLSSLAPVVLEVAEGGDLVADEILRDAAAELAATVAAAVRPFGSLDSFPLALAGGLLVSSADYRRRLLTALADRGLTAGPVVLVREPAEGAVLLALSAVSHETAPTR